MNINMNKKTLTVLGLAMMLGLSSCHADLDRMPTNITTAEKVYSTPEGVKQSLAKVYGTYAIPNGDVQGQNEDFTDFVRSFYNLQELPTDEAICAWNDNGIRDFHNLSWSSSNPYVKGLFYRSTVQIKFANEFLKNTAGRANEPTIKQYRAEARFIRAFQNWVLMDIYGNPPFISEDLPVGSVAPQQIQRADLFKYIESELKAIEADLAEPRANEYGRADKAAAWALLARLYLNAEVYTGTARYADAATYAERVITSGKYSLGSDYSNLFKADNETSPETILSANYDGLKTQVFGGLTFIINAASNGEAAKALNINWSVAGWGGNRATKEFANLFPIGDKRILFGAVTPEINDVSKFAEGYWVYKFRNITSKGEAGKHSTFVDTDMPLFRLAEMYLIYAEAAARGAADKTKGLNYINLVRSRAGISPLSASGLTPREVLDERGRELYWEGHRRTDLVRFNLLTSNSYLWAWKGNVIGGRGVDSKYNIYPLPADDVQANTNLKQHTGY